MKKILNIILTLTLLLITTSQVNAATLDKRLSGNNRYETGAKIASEGWETSEYAIIASGEGFADALCAAPLAKKYNAPILLTGKNALDSYTKNELKLLNVKKVFIVGGSGVVSDNVNSEVKGMGIETNRIYGQDRFETSLEVAKNLGSISGVVVTNGFGFADALSIAPVAAQKGMPILLTDKADLSQQVKNFLTNVNYEKSYVVGGNVAVSDYIASQIKNVTRLGGKNRYETNAAVLNQFGDEFSYDKVYVASGQNYPDALSGSALAALSNSPLILVGTSVDPSVMASIKDHHDKYNNVIILGGSSVVSDTVANSVVSGIATVIVVTPIAIKKEFEKMGFIFDSGTTATYKKNGITIGLVNVGEYWQLATKTWGDEEESLFYRGMTIILGQSTAWSNLIYIDQALEFPDSVFISPNVRTFISDDKLIVHIFKPKLELFKT